jgi:hypothetical protein
MSISQPSAPRSIAAANASSVFSGANWCAPRWEMIDADCSRRRATSRRRASRRSGASRGRSVT